MRYREVRIDNVQALLTSLSRREISGDVWYRGQSIDTWELIPTLLRSTYNPTVEQALVTRFMRDAVPFLDRPPSEWGWVFLMRHHGVPTRLLDWTESPLVALYFAVANTARDDSDGILWGLLPRELNRVSNWRSSEVIPLFEMSAELDAYLPRNLWSEETSTLSTVAGIAMRGSGRMQAQKSVFTVSHRDETAIESLGSGNHVWRYRIPSARKKEIRDQLRALAINRLTVFPELDNVAEQAKEQAGV